MFTELIYLIIHLPGKTALSIHPFLLYLTVKVTRKPFQEYVRRQPIYIASGYPVHYRKIKREYEVSLLIFTLRFFWWEDTEITKFYPKGFHYSAATPEEVHVRMMALEQSGFFS